jgi:hypothetical protein
MSEQFEQLKLTHESPAYWRVTFDHPPINLLDDNTMPDLERLLDLMQAGKELNVYSTAPIRISSSLISALLRA